MSIEYFKVNGVQVANIKNSSEIALFGFAFRAGSNYETKNIAGVSHYAEHLFFKGTHTRNSQQINQEFAKLGVNNNAYTSNNEVFYHTTCPKQHIPAVIDLMSDMLFNSTFPEDELEKERTVIIEEKKSSKDNPQTAFSNAIGNNFFKWEIGHDIIGEFDTIKSIQRSDIINYLENKVNLHNLLFICSGDIDSENLKKYIEDCMPSEHPFLKDGQQNIVDTGFWSDIINEPNKIKFTLERDNITQSNIDMMVRGLAMDDNMFFDMAVICKAIGGGMYSLLWEKIRAELGLCYSVGMITSGMQYPNKTLIDLYGFTSPENIPLFIEASEEVLEKVKQNGISRDVFDCAKADLIAGTLRQTETSAGKALYMVRKCLFKGKGNIEERIEAMEKVSLENCNILAKALFDTQYNWAVMIPKENK